MNVTPIYFDPATYNSSVVGVFNPGELYSWGEKVFKYLQYTDFSTFAHSDGDVMEWAATTGVRVTGDRSGGASLGRMPGGVAIRAAVANLNYQFFLVHGIHTAIGDAANGCTAGRKLTTHATTDGDAANVANAYDISFGDCIDVTSVTTCMALVRLL